MKLLTSAIVKQLPPLGATAEQRDPLCIVKFFYPDFAWTWYAIEGEPITDIYGDGDFAFFGFVAGDFPELGSFRLSELMHNRDKLGCPIERDRGFTPTPLSSVRAYHEGHGWSA